MNFVEWPLKPSHIDRFPRRVLLCGPLLGFAIAAALWGCIAFELFMDLVVNWLTIPGLLLMLGIAVIELVAVPLGIYRAGRAKALSNPWVVFSLAFATVYVLFAAYLSVAAIYSAN